MKGVIKKELSYILSQLITIFEVKSDDVDDRLKELSDKEVEMIALYKDLDLISLNVLVYSLYKTIKCIPPTDQALILKQLNLAKNGLKADNLTRYNRSIRKLFETVRGCNAKVKEHLDDVMHATRIKKGTTLLQKGLSIGQAAGLMGLSNWDLQQYAGKSFIFFFP